MNTETVWNDFSQSIRHVLLRKARSPEDADDLLQDIFLKIHNGLASLEDDAKLTPWVYRIVNNTVTDYYRKKNISITELDSDTIPSPDESDNDIDRHLKRCLGTFIDNMPPDYRQALVKSELQGMKQADIADQIGLSHSGVKSRVQRGRQKLKQMFMDCCHLSLDNKGKLHGDMDPENCTLCGSSD